MGSITDECQEWDGSKNTKGYGRIELFRRTPHRRVYMVHRLVWEEIHGPIPPKMQVCHRCDNPPCINIEHLFLGTMKDNHDDSKRKGRTAHGARNGQAKLTDADVIEIRRLVRAGHTRSSVAKMFGMSGPTVSVIVRRLFWKHLP